jgi:hypothetical protein
MADSSCSGGARRVEPVAHLRAIHVKESAWGVRDWSPESPPTRPPHRVADPTRRKSVGTRLALTRPRRIAATRRVLSGFVRYRTLPASARDLEVLIANGRHENIAVSKIGFQTAPGNQNCFPVDLAGSNFGREGRLHLHHCKTRNKALGAASANSLYRCVSNKEEQRQSAVLPLINDRL